VKITGVEYFMLDLPMDTPYVIAYETISETKNIVLKITTSDGLTGWGCAAPDKEITRESPEDVIRAIENTIIPMLKGENPFGIARFNDLLKQQIPAMKSSMAMVDIALHDLLARKAHLPLYQLMGGFRHKIPTSITIGIMTLPETMELATKYWNEGFRILKLKGGLNMEEDVEKVFKLREHFGEQLVLRFDANQGYSVAESISFVELAQSARIEIFEQPTAYGNEEAMKKVVSKVSVPVMADESIRSLKDAFRLSSNEMMDMVNIKIMKVGGLLEAQHINSVAKAAGMEVMVGCLDECALGIAAGLHFTLSRPNVEYADLDGHLELLNDPFTNLFKIEEGWIIPSQNEGLGKVNL
jgi:L-alanine-DL-glutamate epimerase-like enolase superfamily enzyme